jgi:uncharacterized protein HemX
MSDQIETQATTSTQPQAGYATQPNAFRPDFANRSPQPQLNGALTAGANSPLKPMVLVIALVVLGAALVYQQTQINHLNQEMGLVNDHLKSSDFRDRLDSHDAKLDELNARLTYLDSKVSATDGKAQSALAKLKEQEENDIIGNAIKALKHTFGLQ